MMVVRKIIMLMRDAIDDAGDDGGDDDYDGRR